MAKIKNKKKQKNNLAMHGRRLSKWKIVIISVLVFIIALLAVGYVFMQTYVPDVDDNPHFAQIKNENGLSLVGNQGIYKNHISRGLANFGKEVERQLELIKAQQIVRVDGIYNFLLLGHDKVALNTDVIMVASFNTVDGSINIMQLPRDTYIEHDGYAHKINSMFAYLVSRARARGETSVYHAALSDFCTLLENALSIELDNYALINLQAFESIVDAVGGVPINVPEAMHYDDIYQNLSIHIEAGEQVLDGQTAAGFVRFRSGYLQADIGRQNAQKIFMAAFLKRVKETISVNTVAKITEQALKNLTTDISLADAVYYAKEALSVDLSNMNMMTLPGEAIYSDGISYYVIYRNGTLEIVNDYFNVYSADVPGDMFDKDLLFTDARSPSVERIYRKDDAQYVVNNGESVDQSGIYIPRYYGEPEEEDESESESEAVEAEELEVEPLPEVSEQIDEPAGEQTESEEMETTEAETEAVEDDEDDGWIIKDKDSEADTEQEDTTEITEE